MWWSASKSRQATPFGSSAVVGSFVTCQESGVAEESEDPWPCGPGFGRVCLYRRETWIPIAYGPVPLPSRSQASYLSSSTSSLVAPNSDDGGEKVLDPPPCTVAPEVLAPVAGLYHSTAKVLLDDAPLRFTVIGPPF